MLAAIHRVYEPGCKFEIMVCLVGGQGAGKSTFFRFLAINDEWFTDDLKRMDDDNVYRKMQGHWIIEMSEMLIDDTVIFQSIVLFQIPLNLINICICHTGRCPLPS